MDNTKKHISKFFLLSFLFTLPTYILVALASNNILLTADMAVTLVPLGILAPIGAGLILSKRENGSGGMKELLKRGFEFKNDKGWKGYLPTFFMFPLLFALAYGLLFLMKSDLPEVQSPLYFAPLLFISFFIMAYAEETGWMGYAFDRMQMQSGALKASHRLAFLWVLWHLPFYIFIIEDYWSILFMLLCLYGARFIIVWIYSLNKRSVFAAICAHAMFNVAIALSPNYQDLTGIILSCIFIMITVLILVFAGGLKKGIQTEPK